MSTRSSQNRDSVSSGKITPRREFFAASAATLNGSKHRSPVSPTRITRLQEKEEMQSLNDRLVIYIDTVRNLESENYRLKTEMSSFNEVSTRDVSEIKVLYERELEDAKRLIDELAKEKAKFEIDVNKYKANAQDYHEKMVRYEREAKDAKKEIHQIESQLTEYKSRCDSMTNDLNRKTEELRELKPQCIELENHLARLRKQLEDETLARVDLENKNSTLKEDLHFKTQIYDKEQEQLRASKRTELEQVDNRLRDEYDSKLMRELNTIRSEADMKIKEMKDELERRYLAKFQDSETNTKRSQHTVESLRDELSSHRAKSTDYETDIKNLNIKISTYENRLKEMEEKLKKQQVKFEKELQDRDAMIDKTRSELNVLLSDYSELYDIKIALDMEIEAYRKILEAEETRLNITNTSRIMSGSYINESLAGTSSKKSKKRKVDGLEVTEQLSTSASPLLQQSGESKIGLNIGEMELEVNSMTLSNSTDQDMPIGGFILKQTVDANEVDYKIPKSRVIKAGESLTIWSSTAGEFKKADDLILGGSKQWLNGSSCVTILNDKEGNEVSRREYLKVQMEAKVASTTTTVKTETKSTFGKLFSWTK